MCQAFQHINLDDFPLPEIQPEHSLLVIRPARRTSTKFGPVDRVYVVDTESTKALDYAMGFDLVATGRFHLGCPVHAILLSNDCAQHHVSNVLEVVPV